MNRFALKVYYRGENFFGSQVQPDKRTVEGEFIASLQNADIDFNEFRAAGRTDKGVSALGNVFTITTDSSLIKPRILNTFLPEDIKVWATKKTPLDFNPRHASERIYKYVLQDEKYDLKQMKKACTQFKGERSFHNFSLKDNRNPLRKINQINVEKKRGMLVMTFSGESFLWQMVRRIVTVLKQAGAGETTFKEINTLLQPETNQPIPPSEPNNLILWDVKYDFEFNEERYSKKHLQNKLASEMKKLKVKETLSNELINRITNTP